MLGREGAPVALAVVIAVVASCSSTPTPSSPTPDPFASAASPSGQSPAPTPTEHATPSAPQPIGAVWRPATGIGDGWVSDIAHGSNGWVAVGASCADCGDGVEAAWFSTDGITWSSAHVEGSSAPSYFRTVATDGSTWFAASERWEDDGGSSPLIRARLWKSADGVTWSVTDSFRLGRCLEGCPSVEDLAAGPGGVILSWAHAIKDDRRTAWWSQDGSTWDRVDKAALGLSPDADMWPNTATIVGDTFVLAGGKGDGWAVWSSLDGRDWQEDTAQPSPDPSYLELATDGRRVVAVANSYPYDRETAIWTSADGLTDWTLGLHVLPISQPSVTFAATTFFALGAGSFDEPHIYSSVDGRVWTEIGNNLDSCGVAGLFGADDRLLLAGDEDCPGVWVSMAPGA